MKRSAALEPLSHDHYAGLRLVQRVRAGLAPGGDVPALADEVAGAWEQELLPHFRTEEALLLTPLAATGGAALAARLRDEHEALRSLAAALHASPTGALLEQFAHTLQQHIRFEEREVFPHLEQHAAPEVLEALGRALRAAPPAGKPPR